MRKSVLIIDDSSNVRKTLCDIFELNDYDVTAVPDGTSAITFIESHPCDVVLIDIGLPDIDGTVLLETILKQRPEAVCFIITGHSTVDSAVKTLENGAAGYFRKPIDVENVLCKIRNTIKIRNRKQMKDERHAIIKSLYERLSLAMEAGNIAWWEMQLPKGTVRFSDKKAEMLGYPRSRFSTFHDFTDLIHPDDHDKTMRAMSDHLDGKKERYETEYRIHHKNGSYRWLRDIGRVTHRSDTAGIVFVAGIVIDITDRVTYQKEQQVLSEAVKHAAEFIEIIDADHIITYVNPAFEQITGYTVSESVGQHARLLKSGEHTPVFYENFYKTLNRGETWKGILINKKKNGTRYSQKTSVSPIIDSNDNISHYIAIGEDITQDIERQNQAQHSKKLEAVGTLAAGIAHEINTPSQFIIDNTTFLQQAFDTLLDFMNTIRTMVKNDDSDLSRRIKDNINRYDLEFLFSEIPEAFSDTMDGINRVRKIVGAMKDFSHRGAADKQLSDLNRGIKSTATISRNEWKYVADLSFDLDEDLPPVYCSLDDIQQVVLNLIVNAAHALKEKQEESDSLDIENDGHIIVRTYQHDGNAVIEVEDNGPGIPKDVREKIFEPFFTTKEVGVGSGQGLAIAHDIVIKNHGGDIDFKTTVGSGTRFRIMIPLNPEKKGGDT